MTNIILCGGSGTRLWPISRTLMPKQFVKLFNSKSLFQLTVERNSKVCDKNFIVSNAEQYFLAQDQLEENSAFNIKNSTFLLEPIGRNTAPAIALACFALEPEEIVLVTPSDHLIKNAEEYQKVISRAKELALQNNLVTFGIKPTFAETGFGYIESDGTSEDVKAFHEKPDFETATKYLEAGNYYWNSGMFMFKAGVFLSELKKYSPEIYESSKTAFKNKQLITNNQLRITHEFMSAIPSESIDYAVMEKSDKVKVIPSDIGWSDVGSFDALYDELEKDENKNTLNENHISIDSGNNLIYGNSRTIATVDIENCIIVDTGDALLVSKKGSSQKVKQIVDKLQKTQSELHKIHLTGNRPWGTYTVLEDSLGYKIKRIVVNPKKRLSLQKHLHRNEHWVVVSGTATVIVEDKTFLLNENESTYIQAGETHRLSNDTNEPLVIIEVQVGSYTGEDDIIRIEDDFTRTSNE
ncbi:MAG: mannose-1-phosphate guanylyltransferase/mannose-6-phosphate isomerase [Campylobacterota bacterium]